MARSKVNIQTMRSAASELENQSEIMTNNKTKLDETIDRLMSQWSGAGAEAYRRAYDESVHHFVKFAEVIFKCAQTITASADSYGKAEADAMEAIQNKMGRK